MKLKIIMDSGKEYITEKYESVEDLLIKAMPKRENSIQFEIIDNEEKVLINGMRISSIEQMDI